MNTVLKIAVAVLGLALVAQTVQQVPEARMRRDLLTQSLAAAPTPTAPRPTVAACAALPEFDSLRAAYIRVRTLERALGR